MPCASATHLVVDGKLVKCGEKDGVRKCKRTILIDGQIADNRGHKFSLAELLDAAIRAEQVTIDSVMTEYQALQGHADPLVRYRAFDGLTVIGPAELDKACKGLNGENPLNLRPGWIPDIPIPADFDEWIRSLVWRDDPEWKTRAALVLTPPDIAGIKTSLLGQNRLWGVAHDDVPAGMVRQDVFWSNHFVQPMYDWAKKPSTDQWCWRLIYERPLWTTELSWEDQKRETNLRGLSSFSTAAQEAFALNVILAATGIHFRATTWSRTCTIHNGNPVDVAGSESRGIRVFSHRWNPKLAEANITISIQGVPLPECLSRP